MVEKKPPRMRAACGHCHGAKVKCSGEKSGCSRCLKLDLICEYGISMVGRASKKKGDDGDVTMDEACEGPLPPLDGNPADAFILPTIGDDDGMGFNFAPQDFLTIAGLNDFSFHAFPDNVSSASSAMPALSTGTSEASADESSPHGTRGANHRHRHGRQGTSNPTPDAPSAEDSTRPPLPDAPLSLETFSAARISSTESMEPIFCLARLVYFLEARMAAAAGEPLDKTLTVVKASLRELMEVVKWEGCMASYGCRALVFAVLTLIVKLYSGAFARFRAGYKGPPDAYVKLGSFEVDPEDQWRFQNMMIAGELGRCVQVIKQMAKEQTKRCERGDDCAGAKNFECLAETAAQMKTTLERESVHDKRMVHPLI